MAFISQVSTKGKEVSQKAKDLAEQTKIKNMIKSENEKIETLYQAIGKLFYENETEQIKEPYADIVNTIKVAMDKIDEYEEKIGTIKSKYSCPACGATVTSTTQFCKQCGTKITNFDK